MYGIADPDDGTCEKQKTVSQCLDESSDFEAGKNMCYWDYETEKCHINDVSGSLERIVIVAIISALFSIPIALTIQWILSECLARRTETASDHKDFSRQRNTTVTPSLSLSNSAEHPVSASVLLNEYKALTAKMKAYRSALNGSELKEFDGMCNVFVSCITH